MIPTHNQYGANISSSSTAVATETTTMTAITGTAAGDTTVDKWNGVIAWMARHHRLHSVMCHVPSGTPLSASVNACTFVAAMAITFIINDISDGIIDCA